MNMNWTEKYRPQTIGQVIGQPKLVADAETWIEKNDMPNVMLYGRPGIGKTTVAHILGNHFLGDAKPDDFLEINASQDRKLETVRETISNFCANKSYVDSKFKIVLLDEIEGMTRDSQRALKRTMERFQNVRFVITCNDPYGVDDALRSRCANYLLQPIPSDVQVQRLGDIIADEGADFDEDSVLRIVDYCGGDFRRAINELQACIYSGATPEQLNSHSLAPYVRCIENAFEDPKESVAFLEKLALSGHSVKDMCAKLLQAVKTMDMDNAQSFKVVATIGEMEWRSRSVTPKVIVNWFVASLVK
jgi:replication factor C small subunit